MSLFILLFLILIAAIPIFIIGYIFYNKDTIKEPKKLLRNLFASGMLSGIVVLVISIMGVVLFPKVTVLNEIDNIFSLIFYAYIFIALIEESSKLFMIYNGSYNNEYFDQAYDIILYSVFVALGFAFFENIVYMFNNPSLETALLRGITAVPAHTCFQVIMGYFLYLSKFNDKKKNMIKALIISVLLHGTYDFLIFSGSFILILCDLVLLISLFFYANSKIKKLIQIDENNLKRFCPHCGNKIDYEYCSNCGYKKQ